MKDKSYLDKPLFQWTQADVAQAIADGYYTKQQSPYWEPHWTGAAYGVRIPVEA